MWLSYPGLGLGSGISANAEGLVERGLTNLQAGGRLPHGQSLGDHCAGSLQFLRADDGFASALATPHGRHGQPGAGPLSNKIALELPECAKQMEDQTPTRRRRVDCLSEGTKPDAALFQRHYRLDQMRQRAAQTVQFPNDQHVAIPHILERRP